MTAQLPPHKRTDQSAIQLSNIHADHGSQDQKHTMPNNKPKLLALPTRYTYPQEPKQILEKFAIQLDFLPTGSLAFARRRFVHRLGSPAQSSSFLLGNSIPNTVYESYEQGKVDGARYACSVLQVELREVGHDGLGRGAVEAMGGYGFREDGHGYREGGIGGDQG